MSINDQNKFFLEELHHKFNHNLSEYHIKTLANMFAFYYSMRESKEPVHGFIETLIKKIKIFIGDKTLVNNDFSLTLALFIAGITSDAENTDNAILVQDLSEVILAEISHNKDPELKITVRLLIKRLFSSFDIRDTIHLLYNKPELFMNLVGQSMKRLSTSVSIISQYDIKSSRRGSHTLNLSSNKIEDLLSTTNIKNWDIDKNNQNKSHVDKINSSSKKAPSKGKHY